MNRKSLLWPLVLLTIGVANLVHATKFRHAEVDRLIHESETLDGVVFELVSWDEDTWTWAAPMLAELRRQLRMKYPEIDVVVVSHGGEQFELTTERREEQPEAIQQLASLSEDGMSLHVCGTHSSWQDVPEDAYLDFVDVAPSGPAQINDYIKLGYRHILLDQPE